MFCVVFHKSYLGRVFWYGCWFTWFILLSNLIVSVIIIFTISSYTYVFYHCKAIVSPNDLKVWLLSFPTNWLSRFTFSYIWILSCVADCVNLLSYSISGFVELRPNTFISHLNRLEAISCQFYFLNVKGWYFHYIHRLSLSLQNVRNVNEKSSGWITTNIWVLTKNVKIYHKLILYEKFKTFLDFLNVIKQYLEEPKGIQNLLTLNNSSKTLNV